MSCSNCYNGCPEIVSDKCVKYTGIDVPVLGIQTGDSLSYVEQALIEFLTSALNGTGITPVIDPTIICSLVSANLPTSGTISLNQMLTALIKSSCQLQTQITAINNTLTTLNADYTIGCLTGVTASSDTHDILQAVITRLCATSSSLTALAANLSTNYVKLSDLDELIQDYLDSLSPIEQQYVKMVPFTVVEYYGSLSNFSSSGAGIAGLGWDKIYLCNGANGTPDKRGRIPVGAIQGISGGGTLDPVINPSNPGNPNYALSQVAGSNTVTLSPAQMPSHTHTSTVTVNDPGHTHTTEFKASQADLDEPGRSGTLMNRDATFNSTAASTSSVTGISVNVVNNSAGNSQSHNNIPPVMACYYIMYIPS
jgi:microcystin-dependent protein